MRALPQDVEAEASLLATLCGPGMESRALEIVPTLSEHDFLHPSHRILFRALKGLVMAQEEVGLLTLKDAIDLEGNLGRVGGTAGLAELLSSPEVGRPAALVQIIQRKRALRDLIVIAGKALNQAETESEDPGKLLSDLNSEVLRLMSGGFGGGMEDSDFSAGIQRFLNGEALIDTKRLRLPCFGVPGIDEELIAPPGSLGIIAAKTSAGKTSLAIQGLIETWRSGRKAAIFSLEMSDEELEGRLIAAVTDNNSKAVMRGHGHKTGHMELIKMGREIRKVAKIPGRSFDAVCLKMREMVAKYGIEVFFVDYFTLLNPPDTKSKSASMAFLLGEMSKGFKALASDLGCAIVVLSQFNREVKDGERPILENLRETGQLEQDASWALLMWTDKPRYESAEIRLVHLELQKNRGGARWIRASCSFDPATGRFGQANVPADAPPPCSYEPEKEPW